MKIYKVGGAVRDSLLGIKAMDTDWVVVGSSPDKMISKGFKPIGKNFPVFLHPETNEEYALARTEKKSGTGYKGFTFYYGDDVTLEDDLSRRDFTINALALSLSKENFGELIDPFGGMRHLDMGIIKTPLDPDITFCDDPLRMLRAIRFATQLDFSIVPESLKAIQRNAERLQIISMERVHTELNKIIMADKPSIGFKLLSKTGLLKQFFPEMEALRGVEKRNGISHKNNFFHTLEVLENVCKNSDNLWLRWAAIMHDIAKPPTKRFSAKHGWTFHGHEDKGARMVPKIFQRLKLPMDSKMKFVQKLVLLHLRPIALTKDVVTDSAIRRLLYEAGDDIDELMILCRADITSKNEAKVTRYLRNYDIVVKKLKEVEASDHIRNFQPPVSGEQIMETFGIPPSRPIGDIKKAIKEAILDGDIKNDPEEAYELMLRLGENMGLTRV